MIMASFRRLTVFAITFPPFDYMSTRTNLGIFAIRSIFPRYILRCPFLRQYKSGLFRVAPMDRYLSDPFSFTAIEKGDKSVQAPYSRNFTL